MKISKDNCQKKMTEMLNMKISKDNYQKKIDRNIECENTER